MDKSPVLGSKALVVGLSLHVLFAGDLDHNTELLSARGTLLTNESNKNKTSLLGYQKIKVVNKHPIPGYEAQSTHRCLQQ